MNHVRTSTAMSTPGQVNRLEKRSNSPRNSVTFQDEPEFDESGDRVPAVGGIKDSGRVPIVKCKSPVVGYTVSGACRAQSIERRFGQRRRSSYSPSKYSSRPDTKQSEGTDEGDAGPRNPKLKTVKETGRVIPANEIVDLIDMFEHAENDNERLKWIIETMQRRMVESRFAAQDFVQFSAVEKLVGVLNEREDEELQKIATECLGRMTFLAPSAREEVHMNGGIQIMMRILQRCKLMVLKEHTVYLLANVIRGSSEAERVCFDMGGLGVLVQFCILDNTKLQISSLRAMAAMVGDFEGAARDLMNLDAFPTIVKLLESSDMSVKRFAMLVLANSARADTAFTLFECGLIAKLKSALDRGDKETRKCALKVLRQLLKHVKEAAAICIETYRIETFLKLMKDADPLCRSHAIHAFVNITKHFHDVKLQFHNAGGTTALINILTNSTSRMVTDEDERLAAILALTRLVAVSHEAAALCLRHNVREVTQAVMYELSVPSMLPNVDFHRASCQMLITKLDSFKKASFSVGGVDYCEKKI